MQGSQIWKVCAWNKGMEMWLGWTRTSMLTMWIFVDYSRYVSKWGGLFLAKKFSLMVTKGHLIWRHPHVFYWSLLGFPMISGKNLRAAKHRFESIQKPTGRIVTWHDFLAIQLHLADPNPTKLYHCHWALQLKLSEASSNLRCCI